MSQIVSSLPNKFEQGIFAALCFDFSLSKNLVIYIVPLRADHFLLNISLVIGSAKVNTFFTP
ncbi:MAG TPA: hypothetical protein VIJ25_07375, partial [Methylococcales bacterium]